MSERLTSNYEELLKQYRELADALHMIRRAADRAVRAGVLPSIENRPRRRYTPLQECQAIARAIYAAAGRKKSNPGADRLAGLERDRELG